MKSNSKFPIYLKVLDIGYSSNGIHVIHTKCNKQHVPVIYIDNNAMKNVPNSELYELIFGHVSVDNEVQFDCDWSKSTQKKYFVFLQKMRAQYRKTSATIRLHQIKYRDITGVPPVDSGVLMLYNMSDFLDPATTNYILDLEISKQYLTNFKRYPIHLDLALPIYSMATIIRYGKVVRLLDNISPNDIDSNFIKIKNNLFKIKKTHYFKGTLLYEGDLIRLDRVNLDMLSKAIHMIPFDFSTVILFRYDNIENIDISKLVKLLQL